MAKAHEDIRDQFEAMVGDMHAKLQVQKALGDFSSLKDVQHTAHTDVGAQSVGDVSKGPTQSRH